MRDLIVTGIPRSGTTLLAALVDGLPGTVCLNEPPWQVTTSGTAAEFAPRIAEDFTRLRRLLLAGEPIPDRRSPQGAAVTDYYRQEAVQPVPFVRAGLSPDFMLAVKHNGPYLAALGALLDLGRFDAVAIVRHPVPVIYSWRTLDLPISRGQMPGAVACWPRMAALVSQPMDLLEKQVRIYDLMCRRLHKLRGRIHLLTYEKLLENPGLLNRCLGLAGASPAAGLIATSTREVPAAERGAIADAVRRFGEYYAQFYPEV